MTKNQSMEYDDKHNVIAEHLTGNLSGQCDVQPTRLRQGHRGGHYIFAAVGKLQFEVMQHRLKDEYGVETVSTPLPYQCSAWLVGDLKPNPNHQLLDIIA